MARSTFNDKGEKLCKQCGRFLPPTDEYFRRNRNKKLVSPCRDCVNGVRAQNPSRYRSGGSNTYVHFRQKALVAQQQARLVLSGQWRIKT